MIAGMPPAPTPTAAAKLVAYRTAGATVAVLVTALTAVYGSTAPWVGGVLAVVEAVVIGAIGVALGVPINAVLELALAKLTHRDPERAAELALGTLQSLPPAQTVTATQQLFASLPPSARARASILPAGHAHDHDRDIGTTIQFVGLDDDAPADDADAPRLIDPTGTPIGAGMGHDHTEPTRPTRPTPRPRRPTVR